MRSDTALEGPPRDSGVDWYVEQREHWRTVALSRAFPHDDGEGWDPGIGWRANRSRVIGLYDYYRNLFNQRPDRFLWAGLARLAGGAVVSGLDAIPDDRNPLVEAFLNAGQDIFHDLAWQHEAALEDPADLLALASFHDAHVRPCTSYRRAWEKICGQESLVAQGNRELLQIEQFSIAQPRSDALRENPAARMGWLVRLFGRAAYFTLAIHPYHRDFIADFPAGDPRDADQRWAWIALEDGMWSKWTMMPAEERARLVNLPFDRIARGSFGAVIPELLPVATGAAKQQLSSRRARLAREILRTYRLAREPA
jgi:hypothetical protein